ncbi:hypothetical protein LCGC14_0608710 [marine sediment metagenome]|uniref:Uncharacterized protein n=1 Tax=marine sediment metagenome TaxID=412755 RepID=A0A0F9RSL2_9ZZZZ
MKCRYCEKEAIWISDTDPKIGLCDKHNEISEKLADLDVLGFSYLPNLFRRIFFTQLKKRRFI